MSLTHSSCPDDNSDLGWRLSSESHKVSHVYLFYPHFWPTSAKTETHKSRAGGTEIFLNEVTVTCMFRYLVAERLICWSQSQRFWVVHPSVCMVGVTALSQEGLEGFSSNLPKFGL